MSRIKSFFIPEMSGKPDIGNDLFQNLKYHTRWFPLMLVGAVILAGVVRLCGGG